MATDKKSLRNVNILRQVELPTPLEVKGALEADEKTLELVLESRDLVAQIFQDTDPRYVVVVGPCSIHDSKAAIEYAERLSELSTRLDSLCVVMRTYFEKPRTSVGWKGFINDPYLDDSFRISDGLYRARELLLKITNLGLPVGTEALDPITPQYLDDLITWYAIGARTVESQTHREMASGLSAPVGIKNGTDGSIEVMKNALLSVTQGHHFLGISSGGKCAVYETKGNQQAHGILRGGKTPNYDEKSIAAAEAVLQEAGLIPHLMVDCSHGNSGKKPEAQQLVVKDLIQQISNGRRSIKGFMLESNLKAGNQKLIGPLSELEYGISITDGCIGWEETESLLTEMNEAFTKLINS